MYFVGTFKDYTCFPSIDRAKNICRGKLMKFNPVTGSSKINGKAIGISSLPAELKLKENFNYKQIFFGEHLLDKFPNKPVGIVESEKSAIIASLCYPETIWLATASKQWLKVERLKQIGHRSIILFPDVDGYQLWQGIATDARKAGLYVDVSMAIENNATDKERTAQVDLADYLIEKQRQINQYNSFVDSYNLSLQSVLQDERLMCKFNRLYNSKEAELIRLDDETKAESIRDIVRSLTNL